MPTLLKKTQLIDVSTIMEDLKRSFPSVKVKRGITGNINLYIDADSLVVIKVTGSKAIVIGTTPIIYGLLNPPGLYGLGEGKKRAAENKYACWLKEQYNGVFI